MKKINEFDKFLNERFYEGISKEKIEKLITKAKTLIPQEKINSFIEDNKQQIEEVSDLITDESGDIDYNKVREFFKAKLKNK